MFEYRLVDERGRCRLGALAWHPPGNAVWLIWHELGRKHGKCPSELAWFLFSYSKKLLQYTSPQCHEAHQAAVVKDAVLVLFLSEVWQEWNSSVNLSEGHKGLMYLKIDTANLEVGFSDVIMMNIAGKRMGIMVFGITCLQDCYIPQSLESCCGFMCSSSQAHFHFAGLFLILVITWHHRPLCWLLGWAMSLQTGWHPPWFWGGRVSLTVGWQLE